LSLDALAVSWGPVVLSEVGHVGYILLVLGGVHFRWDVSVLAVDNNNVVHLEVRGRHVELGVEEVSSSESIEGPEEEDGASSEESLTGKLGRTPVDLLWGNLVELVLERTSLEVSDGDDLSGESSAQLFSYVFSESASRDDHFKLLFDPMQRLLKINISRNFF